MTIRYIFPRTDNFREERPRLCWEHMYGWFDGYGCLFDPVVMRLTKSVPQWENGWPADGAQAEDFLIAPCPQACLEAPWADHPGLYVRPENDTKTGTRLSEKEALCVPGQMLYYPCDLPFDIYPEDDAVWRIAGRPAIRTGNRQVHLAFDFFSLLAIYNHDLPESRLLLGADLLTDLLGRTDCFDAGPDALTEGTWQPQMRVDFQAYGICRLQVQWFLELFGQDRGCLADADEAFLRATAAWEQGQQERTVHELTAAFGALAQRRRDLCGLDVSFLEYPHLGILLEDKGFFELEWPEKNRKVFLTYVEQVEKHGYCLSLEGGASCWQNLQLRFPDLIRRLTQVADTGRLEFVNGTFSLPYALVSPLALQYWQFETGLRTHKAVFGSRPRTYEAQENSLSLQMPELLRHFRFDQAVHVTHNRGCAPAAATSFIEWQGASGMGIPAMAVPDHRYASKGNNYFFDLPLVYHEQRDATEPLNYINCMDLGYPPLRMQMIRAHKYAPLWGRFNTTVERMREVDRGSLPAHQYVADEYRISESIFYGNYTNANALSQYETIFSLTARQRQLRLAALLSGRWNDADVTGPLREAVAPLLVQEAHDVCVVQDQRRGEFHNGCTLIPPPYNRDTLMAEIGQMKQDLADVLDGVVRALDPDSPDAQAFNAASATLPFARVRPACSLVAVAQAGSGRYVAGPFAPWSLAAPGDASMPQEGTGALTFGPWQVTPGEDGRVCLVRDGAQVHLAPVDSRHGAFALRECRWRAGPSLAVVSLEFIRRETAVTAVEVDMILGAGEDAPSLAELVVRYAPGRDFDSTARWDDNLAMAFDSAGALEEVFRFNPNVRGLTRENRVVSPCTLALEWADSAPLSFLNEGAFCYELDRPAGQVRWLFHVANEMTRERRMALVFNCARAFPLAQAWMQGVLPLAAISRPLPAVLRAAENLNIETVTDREGLLLSNLGEDETVIALEEGDGLALRDVLGQSLVAENGQVRLPPFALAFAELYREN